ncbi:MAG TPA: hypothetical protein VEZ20_03165 [Allosphingosinicella sp.]|nr:hypothetical protein [Allosphingosinicella sp.]
MTDAAASREEDDAPPNIRIPHPLEVRRVRPRREPRSRPRLAPRQTTRTRRSVAERWRDPKLEAAPDTGQLRINFKYGAWFTTTAGFSVKSGRAVYHEGAAECAAWIEAETLTSRLDLEFQPLRVVWRRDHGRTRHITLDGGFELEDHSLVFTEYKGDQAYFEEADTADLLDEAEEVLALHGARLRREDAPALVGTMLHRTLKDVFDDRNTTFDRIVDVAAVRESVMSEGGAAPLGVVLEAIGGPVRDASAKLNAMSVRRLVRIDPTRPQMPDTPVDLPPERVPGRLRAFLTHHAVPESEK